MVENLEKHDPMCAKRPYIPLLTIPFKLNLRKEKWLVISIYRPLSQDSEFFLNSLTIILDHFTKTYDNYLIMGRLVFSRFLDLRENLGIVKKKTRKTCFSREKKRLAPRIYQEKFCLAAFL